MCGILPGYCEFKYFYYLNGYWRVYRPTCLHVVRREEVMAMLLRILMDILSAHFAEIQGEFCIIFTPERAQFATPSYKLKKEKREAKKMESASTLSKDITLVDPSTVCYWGSQRYGHFVHPHLLQFLLRRKLRQTSLLPPSPRNLLRASQPQIARLRNLIRSGQTGLIDWRLSWPRLSKGSSHLLSR